MNIKKILRIIKSSSKVTFDTEWYLYKVTDPKNIDWAFIQPSDLGKECEVKLVDSESILFDEMTFDYTSQAYTELQRNGFKRKSEKTPAPPLPPYYDKRGKNPIYSSGECWISPTKIRVDSNDYWVKADCFEALELKTALIEKQKDGVCKVFFIRCDRYIYDLMSFDSIKEAEEGLTRNGFERYDSITKPDNIERHGNNKRLHDIALECGILQLPEQPFKEDKYFFSGGYSSGGYWK
jgi:hypothetical protein